MYRSEEWKKVPAKEREKMNIKIDDDGDQVRAKVGGDDVDREGVRCAKICGQGGRRREVSPDDCSNCLQDEVVTVVMRA